MRGPLDGSGRHPRRADHLRQHRRVERCRSRARAQPIGRTDVVTAGGVDAAFASVSGRKSFGAGPIDAERLAGRDRARSRRNQIDRPPRESPLRLSPGRTQTPGSSTRPGARPTGPNRKHRRANHADPRSSPTTPTGATSPSKSALVACVVECAMNATSPTANVRLAEKPLDAGHDSGGDALGSVVGRGNFDARDRLPRRRIDRDDVGKRAAHVDSDAHAPAAARQVVHARSAVSTNVTIARFTVPRCW